MTGVPPVNPTLISITPKPPIAGQSATVCYDFEPGQAALELSLTWFDEDGEKIGDTIILDVSPESPCVTVDVPADADSYTIQDDSGKSAGISGFVN